jgi:hypothetical protein
MPRWMTFGLNIAAYSRFYRSHDPAPSFWNKFWRLRQMKPRNRVRLILHERPFGARAKCGGVSDLISGNKTHGGHYRQLDAGRSVVAWAALEARPV